MRLWLRRTKRRTTSINTTFIYVLNDPRTNQIRYVGKADDPFRRWQKHCSSEKIAPTYKSNWISELRALGLTPELEILEEVPYDQWAEIEREYIRVFRMIGIRLTNVSEGGEGSGSGEQHPNFGKRWKHSDEEKAAKSLRMKGKKHSQEHCDAVSRALTGKKLSPEHVEAMRQGLLGKPSWNKGLKASDETKLKLSISHLGKVPPNKGMTGDSSPLFGRKKTPEEIEKSRVARTGLKRSPEVLQNMRNLRAQRKAGGIFLS